MIENSHTGSTTTTRRALLFSQRMQQLYEEARHCARYCRSVLIEGETGTGKELLARAVHAASPRAHAPLVVENCSALREELAEAELFGCRRGAYSGADRDRSGLLEAADSGTLFLDELQDLSPAIQGKLLRILESGEFRPVGTVRSQRVDVVVIGALSQASEILRVEFRNRFDYQLRIPPLRERPEEIEPLVRYFVREAVDELGLPEPPEVELEAIEFLNAQEWPGNVRQLKKSIRRTLIRSGLISLGTVREDFAIETESTSFELESMPKDADLLRRYGVDYPDKLTAAMRTAANLDQVAASMKTTRRTLTKHLQILGLPTRGARRRR